MQYIFQDEITICIIAAVREFFGTNKYSMDWKWSPDDNKSKIRIVDSWPETERVFPMIILNAIPSGSAEELGFGQALGRVYGDDGKSIGQYFGGRMDFDVSYEIVSYNKREMRRISDFLTLGLGALSAIPARVSIMSLGNLILSTPRVRLSGERQQSITDSADVHVRTLAQKWQSYWKDEVIYSQEITDFLTTAERDSLEGGSESITF